MAIFSNIPCPAGEACTAQRCLFSHDLHPTASADPRPEAHDGTEISHDVAAPSITEPAAGSKRKFQECPQEDTTTIPSALEATKVTKVGAVEPEKQIDTLSRPVSPPPRKIIKQSHASSSLKDCRKLSQVQNVAHARNESRNKAVHKTEVLHPRKVGTEPVPLAKRKLYLDHLMLAIQNCNKRVEASELRNKRLLTLSKEEMIVLCLDAEQTIAQEYDKMYESMIKKKVMTFKKMDLDSWITFVKSTFAPQADKSQRESGKPSVTLTERSKSLPVGAALSLLPQLGATTDSLEQYGYILRPHKKSEIAKAEADLAAAPNWQICCRCNTRFQCFQDPLEDGQMTTHGPCFYHWGKHFYPEQSRADASMHGRKEKTYTCCGETLSAKGCSRHESHVFKVSDGPGLSLTMPFINTPDNSEPAKTPSGATVRAVSLDCEMCYTTFGFEIVRLTALSWPDHEQLIDVFVRPQGVVLDFNTRFSGVTADAYGRAIPYDAIQVEPSSAVGDEKSHARSLRIVSNPAAARSLLCSFITPSIPLLGHALENDLNVLRLCHPTIIDTAILFPHRQGPPLKSSLKYLAKQKLDRDVQTGGELGHDSMEDAKTTGDLVRKAIDLKWSDLTKRGWTLVKGLPTAPTPYRTDAVKS